MAAITFNGAVSTWYSGSARVWSCSSSSNITYSNLSEGYIGYYKPSSTGYPYVTCIRFTVSDSGSLAFSPSSLTLCRQSGYPTSGTVRWLVSKTGISSSNVDSISSLSNKIITEQTASWSSSDLEKFTLNIGTATGTFATDTTYYLWIYGSSTSDGRLQIYNPTSATYQTVTTRPAFTWSSLTATDANTLAGYVNTYVKSGGATTVTQGSKITATWYNKIAGTLGVSTVTTGTKITKTLLTALATAYNSY